MSRLRRVALPTLLALAALLDGRAAPAEETRRHNLVVIMAGDLGAGELACYGSFKHETPHLDRLAEQGMRFRTCWATPTDAPSRVMILTGQYAHRTGYFDALHRPLTPHSESTLRDLAARSTFANRLDAAGYQTAIVGTWQLHGKLVEQAVGCGFDEHLLLASSGDLPKGATHEGRRRDDRRSSISKTWQPCLLENGEHRPTTHNDFGPNLFADYAVEFLRRHRGTRFLLYFPMYLAQRPWDPTPDLEHPGRLTQGGFTAYVAHLDHTVGRITKTIDELGLAERTLVLFTAGSGSSGRGRGGVTELGVRVPLIARCPGTVPAGRVSDALVSLSDVYPTLMTFARIAIAAAHPVDGVDLTPTLRGEEGVVHRPWVLSYLGKRRLIRDERWLLDGYGRLWDCRLSREGRGYRSVRGTGDSEAQTARSKLEAILAGVPGPEAVKAHLAQTREETRGR